MFARVLVGIISVLMFSSQIFAAPNVPFELCGNRSNRPDRARESLKESIDAHMRSRAQYLKVDPNNGAKDILELKIIEETTKAVANESWGVTYRACGKYELVYSKTNKVNDETE